MDIFALVVALAAAGFGFLVFQKVTFLENRVAKLESAKAYADAFNQGGGTN
jgi:hypothetical protein